MPSAHPASDGPTVQKAGPGQAPGQTESPSARQSQRRSRRGRRPSAQVRAEILAAAGQLLLSDGMAAFTIERVAALAGASKMTIYKWWPSRGVLALEGYAACMDTTLSMPDTGDIEADLTTQLSTYVHVLRDTPAGRVTAELLAQAQTDPELAAAFRRSYSQPRRQVGATALRRAQERGQIRPDADPEMLIDQLWGACIYRLLMRDEPLTDEFARVVVRTVLDGVRT